jgi:hypothetical protein
MIITKSTPFTKEEIENLKEEFEIYIKTDIDIEKKICSAGCNLHADSEKILLEQGSLQKNIWGGGINTETKDIDFNAMINISTDNKSTEIQSEEIRNIYEKLTKYFFRELYE